MSTKCQELKSFDDIKVKLPPYPVYKAFIVPYRDGKNVEKVKREDINSWKEVLSRLRNFLKASFSLVEEVKGRAFSDVEKLELIADLIVLFFKLPLIREPLPSVMPSPIKAYLLCRLLGFEKLRESLRDMGADIEDLLDFAQVYQLLEGYLGTEVFTQISEPELYDLVEKCWFIFPADTRPGYNTSDLLPHLLTTSALAWAKAIEQRLKRKETALVRLAAMLHDMGKPFYYERHYEVSADVADALLEDILSSNEMKEVREFVSKHHYEAKTKEGNILKEADEIASAIDRLTELVEGVIGKRLKKVVGRRVDMNEIRSWKFWEELHNRREELVKAGLAKEDPIRELTEEFVEEVRGRLSDFLIHMRTTRESKPVEGVRLGLVDVGKIQEFVLTAQRLRCVVASSLVVDLLVSAQIPTLVQYHVNRYNAWLPYEAFVCAAGGIVQILFPTSLEEAVNEAIEKLNDKCELPLRFGHTVLSYDYGESCRRLAQKVQALKFKVSSEDVQVRFKPRSGIKNLCDLCYVKTPKRQRKDIPDNPWVCQLCDRLYDIGEGLHFRPRYEKELVVVKERCVPKELFDMPWQEASKWIIEIIAGHSREELESLGVVTKRSEGLSEQERSRVEWRDIAMLKLDGNLMGPFLGTSVSFTDAFERSARIDLAMKKALESAIDELFRGVSQVDKDHARSEAIRIKLGLIYMGGDDALILAPSWAAIPLAFVIGREFARNMGFSRGLSLGLIAAPAKANIWGLLAAVNELMEVAKELGRLEPKANAICFDIFEAGTPSDTAVRERLASLRSQRLSLQPLPLDSEDQFSLAMLIELTLGPHDDYATIFEKAFKASRFEEEGQIAKQLRAIRSGIREVLMMAEDRVVVSGPVSEDLRKNLMLVAYLHATRQAVRLREEEKYETIVKLIDLRKGTTAFADADRIIKIIGGGVI